MPYFLADNFNVGENGELVRKTPEAKPKTVAAKAAVPPKLSLLQRAEQRHKARTPEQIQVIKKAWIKRNRKQATAAAKSALIDKTAKDRKDRGWIFHYLKINIAGTDSYIVIRQICKEYSFYSITEI